VREYAGLKLQEADEVEVVELRCADYYVSRCGRSAAEARFRLVEWLEWMDLEIDNVRSILGRCLRHQDSSRGMALACSLGWYWMTRATSEGVHWLDELLASGGDSPQAHAPAHFLRGFLSLLQVDPTAARPQLEQATLAARAQGQLTLLSQALSMASVAAHMAGDRASTRRLLDEAGAVTGLEDLPATLALLQARALDGLFAGDPDAARSSSSEGVRLSRESGDLYTLDMMLMNLGSAALIAGDIAASKPHFTEALRIAQQIDDRVAQSYLLDALACDAASTGQARLAAQLLGAAETVRTGAGASIMGFLAPFVVRAEESATTALGMSRFAAEREAGTRLSRSAAVALALGERAGASAEAADAGWGPLGRREAEVARLVADGLSNRQIGARLFISEHTVDSHLRSIMDKLGFNSRTQIAAWMAAAER
jgi:DNA-binding CsgD family transcriptional regulator